MIHLYPLANDFYHIFDQNVNQYVASAKKVPAKAVEISGALELEPKAVSTGPQLGWIRTWDDKIYTWGIPPENRSLAVSSKNQIWVVKIDL